MNNNNNRPFKQQSDRIWQPFTIRSRDRPQRKENLTKQAASESTQAGCQAKETTAGYLRRNAFAVATA
jgi:hypothetical protein